MEGGDTGLWSITNKFSRCLLKFVTLAINKHPSIKFNTFRKILSQKLAPQGILARFNRDTEMTLVLKEAVANYILHTFFLPVGRHIYCGHNEAVLCSKSESYSPCFHIPLS